MIRKDSQTAPASLSRLAALLLASLLAACSTGERVILLPDEDGGDPGGVALISAPGEKPIWWTTPFMEQSFSDGKPGASRELPVRAFYQDFGPLLAALPPPPKSFLLYFLTGTTELVPGSEPNLALLFAEVRARSGADVQVTGHTDSVGGLEDNDRLSAARAEEIRRLLIDRGLDSSLVRAVGRGERALLVQTGDEVREQRNRRVEVIVR